MYKLDDIKQVGRIQIVGGIITLAAGIIAQIGVGLEAGQTLISNLLYFALFTMGWFIFNQMVMATIFSKIVDETRRAKLTRLEQPLEGEPPGRWGQSYRRIEIGLMGLWAFSVVVLQLVLGTNLTLTIGGLAAGWLIGGGLGRLRFASKMGQEETTQDSRFYFGDATLGPRTEIAYYTSRPVATAASQTPSSVSSTSLPPGVKRRATAVGTASKSELPKSKTARPNQPKS